VTKLIEVALPLEAISKASRRDKDRKTGTIKNVHKWFAPMPTPAWRALLFATLVDDPGDEEGRARLLDLIERLVPEHGGPPDEATLAEAKKVIHEATGGNLPTVFDPFCGGGSTLVEAQRLGLPTIGSDLNPVPVLITRALTELVPQVAGHPPLVADPAQLTKMSGGRLDGFLADCAHYARRVQDKVWAEIGHLYPPPPGGGTVVAWLWARTVTCPNPACRAITPLASSFWLSKRKGAETWVEPVGGKPGGRVRFEVRTGPDGPPTLGTVGRTAARCLVCREPISLAHVRSEGQARRTGFQLMAVARDDYRGRSYLSPDEATATSPEVTRPEGIIDLEMPDQALGFRVQLYGMTNFSELFTNRQLVALGAFADAVAGIPDWVRADGGDDAYAKAVASVLGLCVGKLAASCSTQVRWRLRSVESKAEPAFGRHALPMVWDFTETNPFGGSVGDWSGQLSSVISGLSSIRAAEAAGRTFQSDARVAARKVDPPVLIATDPPYFAQIGYADLSDYFYVWLRRALAEVHPDLFATVAAPKVDELIAAPYRHGGDKQAAKKFFVEGYTEAFRRLASASAHDLPMLIVYAHRQEESKNGGISSTAWDAMLTAIITAGLRIVGTWPIHATGSSRQIGLGTNALASYVVLVCRPQVASAKVVDRQGFTAALRAELPRSIRKLEEGAVSAIDLAQATIGPGMAIFSRFAKVIEPQGHAMTVRSALELIGQIQGEVLDQFVGDPDSWTRWAMLWYRDHGFEKGSFDDAEKLFKTTNTSLDGLERAGIVRSGAGKVALLSRDQLPDGWSPQEDRRVTVWEVTQHLVKRLATGGGEEAAAVLLRRSRQWADDARNLAYWLSVTAAAKGRAKDVLDCDALLTSWPELVRKADQLDQEELSVTGI
jgi:putative DNA methylase